MTALRDSSLVIKWWPVPMVPLDFLSFPVFDEPGIINKWVSICFVNLSSLSSLFTYLIENIPSKKRYFLFLKGIFQVES